MPRYLNVFIDGLLTVKSLGDGYQINLKWAMAYPNKSGNKIAYHIYMSNSGTMNSAIAPIFPEDFFNNSPAFISVDSATNVNIVDLIPGQMYHFAVRAIEYDPTFFDLKILPTTFNNLRVYPESLLRSNINETDSLIPLVDAEFFPNTGTIKLGSELINYSHIDLLNNNLVLTNINLQRGFNGSQVAIHNTDGYDGYIFWDPNALFWPVLDEEKNTRVYECWNRFDIEHFPFSITDGYRQKVKDILTTDLSNSDASNVGFPAYDFAGYHRTDPVMLLSGECVGSYIGGYMFCADGYYGVGQQVRGLNIEDLNNQRQEVLLSTTGERCVLVNRQWTGMTCKCMLPYNEYPEARCSICFGSGIVVGWQQYFNPRESDGKILVRFDPAVDDLVAQDSGLESTMNPTCWTLTVPTVKDRDFLIRFDVAGNEEFRYEILNVTRNKLMFGMEGVQKFAVQRIRKTDAIYQVLTFKDTSLFPSTLQTSIASVPGAFAPHTHTITRSEKITSISQINEITSITLSHSHVVRNGQITENSPTGPGLGHTHTIII